MAATIETRELEPGLTAYQITSLHMGGVEEAVAELIDRVDREGGVAEFRRTRREYSIHDGLTCWRSRGYVRAA